MLGHASLKPKLAICFEIIQMLILLGGMATQGKAIPLGDTLLSGSDMPFMTPPPPFFSNFNFNLSGARIKAYFL